MRALILLLLVTGCLDGLRHEPVSMKKVEDHCEKYFWTEKQVSSHKTSCPVCRDWGFKSTTKFLSFAYFWKGSDLIFEKVLKRVGPVTTALALCGQTANFSCSRGHGFEFNVPFGAELEK